MHLGPLTACELLTLPENVAACYLANPLTSSSSIAKLERYGYATIDVGGEARYMPYHSMGQSRPSLPAPCPYCSVRPPDDNDGTCPRCGGGLHDDLLWKGGE
jgi:hypothetical protein